MNNKKYLTITLLLNLVFSLLVKADEEATSKLAQATTAANDFVAELASPGIAFSMLKVGEANAGWQNPAAQHFLKSPVSTKKHPEVIPTSLQAVTITRADVALKPYPSSNYGLAFSINENSDFYRYIAMLPSNNGDFSCSAGEGEMTAFSPAKDGTGPQTNWAVSCNGVEVPFCGRCFDGGPCAGLQTANWLIIDDAVSRKNVMATIADIVGNSGIPSHCPWAVPSDTSLPSSYNNWNEFDTRGFSKSALRGVLVNNTPFKASNTGIPADKTFCDFFAFAKGETGTHYVPFFSLTLHGKQTTKGGTAYYQTSKLEVSRILTCPAS